MSDAVEPAAVPETAAAPEPQLNGSADESEYSPEADFAAAAEALKAMRGSEPTPAPAAPVAPVLPDPAAISAAGEVAPPAAPSETEDARLARVFNRIGQLERERDEVKAKVLPDDQLAKLRKYEALFEKAATDPGPLFDEIKWNPDTIVEYVKTGKLPKDPQIASVEQATAAIKAELEALKAERAQQTQESRIQAYKASLPAQLEPLKAETPYISVYFDTPADAADYIYRHQAAVYQSTGQELTVRDSALAVEKVLADQAKRFSRARSETPVAQPSSPGKPRVTLTNTAPASRNPHPAAEDDGATPNFAAALETFRGLRAAE